MAEDLDDGEFWLPPQFLTDDDLLMDFKSTRKSVGGKCLGSENDGGVNFMHEFKCNSFGGNSDLSSPVESVVGSTETESDGEDYLAVLTQKLAQITVQDNLWKAESGLNYENTKLSILSRSPQSTLCDVLGKYGSKRGSSRGSPTYPSQVSSPPAMHRNEADAWDLLCKAADEVARMRMVEDASRFYQNGGLFGPSHQASPVSVNIKNSNPELGFPSEQSISYQQLQATKFQHLREQQMMKQQQTPALGGHSNGSVAQYHRNQSHQLVQNRRASGGDRPLGLSMSAWPTLQQSQQQQKFGSGMRAVFLGNHGGKRECSGTGVFLPRRIGTPAETRKKPACSTVLLPDRVVQALNLNLETMDVQPLHDKTCNPEYDAALKHRNNAVMAQRRSNGRPQAVINNEFRLPQEWTY